MISYTVLLMIFQNPKLKNKLTGHCKLSTQKRSLCVHLGAFIFVSTGVFYYVLCFSEYYLGFRE